MSNFHHVAGLPRSNHILNCQRTTILQIFFWHFSIVLTVSYGIIPDDSANLPVKDVFLLGFLIHFLGNT